MISLLFFIHYKSYCSRPTYPCYFPVLFWDAPAVQVQNNLLFDLSSLHNFPFQYTLEGLFNERTSPFSMKLNCCNDGMFCTSLMNNILVYSLCCFVQKKLRKYVNHQNHWTDLLARGRILSRACAKISTVG